MLRGVVVAQLVVMSCGLLREEDELGMVEALWQETDLWVLLEEGEGLSENLGRGRVASVRLVGNAVRSWG